MSTITTINAGDLITDSRAVINTNFSNLNTDKIETSTLDTDTTLAANSDAKIATQKATKAYVDSVSDRAASETVSGTVEEATDAEVTAGTATGATGKKLFVTPAKLATRIGNLTVVDKVEVDATEVTVTNTATETTLFDVSIAGGTLSTNNAIRAKIWLSALSFNNGANQALDLRLKYGATTVATLNIPLNGAIGASQTLKGFIDAFVIADGATNAQKGAIWLDAAEAGFDGGGSATVTVDYIRGGADGTAAEDSTAAKTLSVTADWGSGASSSTTITAEWWIVERIQ